MIHKDLSFPLSKGEKVGLILISGSFLWVVIRPVFIFIDLSEKKKEKKKL